MLTWDEPTDHHEKLRALDVRFGDRDDRFGLRWATVSTGPLSRHHSNKTNYGIVARMKHVTRWQVLKLEVAYRVGDIKTLKTPGLSDSLGSVWFEDASYKQAGFVQLRSFVLALFSAINISL